MMRRHVGSEAEIPACGIREAAVFGGNKESSEDFEKLGAGA